MCPQRAGAGCELLQRARGGGGVGSGCGCLVLAPLLVAAPLHGPATPWLAQALVPAGAEALGGIRGERGFSRPGWHPGGAGTRLARTAFRHRGVEAEGLDSRRSRPTKRGSSRHLCMLWGKLGAHLALFTGFVWQSRGGREHPRVADEDAEAEGSVSCPGPPGR